MQENTKVTTTSDLEKKTNYAVFYASINIIICVGFIYTLYLNDPKLLFEGWQAFTWLFFLIQMVAVGISSRKALGGFIEFNQLLKPLFKSFAFAYIFKYIFVYVLITVIDPTLLDLSKDFYLQLIIENKDPNWTDEMLQQQIEAFNAQPLNVFDFMGLTIELVMGFIMALIISFVLKIEKPEY